MQKDYIISSETVAVMSYDKGNSKIIEDNNIISVSMLPYDILDLSCKYFGSSLLGRVEGSKYYLGSSYKVPILIDESRNIVFFPTRAYKTEKNCWIAYDKVDNYVKDNDGVKIKFYNGQVIIINESFGVFENQYLRAQKLHNKISKVINTSIK